MAANISWFSVVNNRMPLNIQSRCSAHLIHTCLHIYNIETVYVCVCMCMFAYSLRRDMLICTKIDMLLPRDQKEILERSKLRKIVLSSSSGEGGSCSSETKHDRRMAPRRLQEKTPQTRNICTGFESRWECFCSSESKHDRRMAPGQKSFIYRNKGRILKISPDFESQWRCWV
jgi:hypothetical protein